MKRLRNTRVQSDEDGVIDIASLIDICFLLLIYFIVTTTIIPAERDLPMGPPGESDGQPAMKIDALTVSIDAAGHVFCGEGIERMPLDAKPEVRELPLLNARLKTYKQGVEAAGQKCFVVIDADGDTKSQRVVDVLNALAGEEIEKVTFVDRDEEE